MRVTIVSDTHARALPEPALERLRAADLILHAGDLTRAEDLDALEALGPPVVAVHGNVDTPALRARLPERRVVPAAGVRLGLVHDAGPARGRLARLRRLFAADAVRAVVFGHSHVPLREVADDGFAIFNPGSATDRRRQPHHTMGEATVAPDGTLRLAHVTLD